MDRISFQNKVKEMSEKNPTLLENVEVAFPDCLVDAPILLC